VKALQYVGVEALVELAGRMGIPWADDTGYWGLAIDGPKVTKEQSNTPYPIPNTSAARFGLALTLGGGEVRLLDLTAAYAAFANGGQRVTPFGISRVETLDGEGIRYSVLGNAQSPIPNAQYPLDPRVAYLITDILADNIARIPSFGEQSALRIGRPAAAKTGTTTDWRDNWTMGYTPDLATGVWVGNADNAAMLDVSGITGAGPIWHDFMTSALRDTPPRPFPRPNGLARVEVCADSGLLPSSIVSCPHRRYEWFIAGTEPTQVDNMRRRIAVDVRSGELADALTPPEFVVVETVWALPEEYSEWAREQGISQPIMDDRPRTGGPNASAVTGHPSSVTLASPDPNRVYRLDPGLPASAQRAPITAQVRGELAGDGAPVTLLLDGAIFAQVRGPDYTAWWPLAPGRHVWQAVATQIGGAPAISEPVIITVE
jgi:membrane peptidoglycan carboxypeptidase